MSKAEKIKAEIERLKEETFDNKELTLEEIITARNCYNNLLFFIDSLEQPIKRTPAEIEAALQEVEEKSKLFTEAHKDDVVSNDTIDDLEEAAKNYEEDAIFYAARRISDFFKAGAQWQKANLWKDAQGDDLPEIDREVIVLVKSLPEYEDSLLKVSFAHRPPKYWIGKSISTGEITRYEPKRYDKGGWNQPNVVYWLDVELPKEEE